MQPFEHPLPVYFSEAMAAVLSDPALTVSPEEVSGFADSLTAQGDTLCYGGKPGQAGGVFESLVKVASLLARCPGGVTLFGETYAV